MVRFDNLFCFDYLKILYGIFKISVLSTFQKMELDTIILYRENWTWLPQWIRTCLEDLHYYSSERAFLKSMDSFPCSSDPFPPIRLCWSDHIPTSILSNHSGFGHICSQGRTTTWLSLFTQPGNGLILKLCGRTMHNDGLLVTVVTTNITLGFFFFLHLYIRCKFFNHSSVQQNEYQIRVQWVRSMINPVF